MVDEAREVATLGGVYDALQVDPEEVGGSDADLLVLDLPEVCDDGSHALAHVLYDHLVGADRLHRKQAPVVDARLAEAKQLLAELGGAGGSDGS